MTEEYVHKEIFKDGSSMTEYEGGRIVWCNEDEFVHRIGAPAVINEDGSKEWFFEGRPHRDGGLPANEPGPYSANKCWRYFVNGDLHRDGGPAIEYSDGYEEWFLNGMRHRLDGPALKFSNGDKEWWVDDQLHRLDGPAIEISKEPGVERTWYYDNREQTDEWYIRGKQTTKENVKKLRKEKVEKLVLISQYLKIEMIDKY
jgi:hypothetical protein